MQERRQALTVSRQERRTLSRVQYHPSWFLSGTYCTWDARIARGSNPAGRVPGRAEDDMTNLERALALPPASPAAPARPVSKARSLAASRSRRRWEAARGNSNAMRHGIFALVANERDAATEVALIYAARPSLDGIADLRLVESYALAATQYRRALAAIDRDGLTSILTSYATRLAALVERLERACHDRERERQAAMRRGPIIDLSKYAPKGKRP